MVLAQKSLEVGDIVVLKSGGPEMTVSGIGAGTLVFTMWFDDNNKVQTHEFYSKCLNNAN